MVVKQVYLRDVEPQLGFVPLPDPAGAAKPCHPWDAVAEASSVGGAAVRDNRA